MHAPNDSSLRARPNATAVRAFFRAPFGLKACVKQLKAVAFSLLVLMLFCAQLAWSQGTPMVQPISLQSILTRHDTGPPFETWIDPQGISSPALARQAAKDGKFSRSNSLKPVLLEGGAAQWRRIEIRRNNPNDPWYLQVDSPSLDHASLHWENSLGEWQSQIAGDALAVSDWPLPDHQALFKLPSNLKADADGGSELWLRLSHARVPVSVSATLLSESALREQREISFFAFGAFFGGLILALLVCIYHGIKHRDKVFVAYGLMITAMAGMQMQLSGLAGLTYFAHAPGLNDRASFVFAELYVMAGLLFMATACGVSWARGRLGELIKAWLLLGMFVSCMHQWLFDRAMFLVANWYMPMSMALALVVGFVAHKRGDRYALKLTLGLLPVVIAGTFPLLRNQGVLPTGLLSQYGLMVGAVLELSILTVVLTQRSQELRETQLRERALVSTDALTGLTHETLFLQRLHSSAVRARRYGKQFGLLVLSLDNIEQLGRDGGFSGRERAVLLAASRLRSVAREIDTPCRVTHDELVLLIEGPANLASLTDTATRVLARMLRPASQLPPGAFLKTHITATLLPAVQSAGISGESTQGLSAAQTLQWLLDESRSYRAGSDKAVRIIESSVLASIA